MISVNDIEFEYSKTAEKFFRKHEDIREEFRISVAHAGSRGDIYKRFQG